MTTASNAFQWNWFAIQKTLMLTCSKKETRRCVVPLGGLTATSSAPGLLMVSIGHVPSCIARQRHTNVHQPVHLLVQLLQQHEVDVELLRHQDTLRRMYHRLRQVHA